MQSRSGFQSSSRRNHCFVEGTRKRLFKPTVSTGGTKMKIVQALLSPRKRAAAKTGSRQGDISKQMEDKGTSNPQSSQHKP
ncbi:hypothetical protein Bca101_030213 [Brassica carinata]